VTLGQITLGVRTFTSILKTSVWKTVFWGSIKQCKEKKKMHTFFASALSYATLISDVKLISWGRAADFLGAKA